MIHRVLGLTLMSCGLLFGAIGVMLLALPNPQQGPDKSGLTAVAIVILLVGLVILGISVILLMRTTPIDGDRVTVLDGKVGRYFANQPQVSEVLGQAFTTLYRLPISGKRHRPSLLRFAVKSPIKAPFSVTTKNWLDRLCVSVGMVKAIRIGDTGFDDQCYVRTDAFEFAKAFLSEPASREAILDLRELGFTEVALRDGEIQANWRGFNPEKHDKPEMASAVASRLLVMADRLRLIEAPLADRGVGRRQIALVFLWITQIGFGLTTLFFYFKFPPLVPSELLVISLALSIPAFLVFGWFAAWLLHGTSTSHDRWAKLMIMGLILFPVGGVGTASALNGLLDASQPMLHRVIIYDRTIDHRAARHGRDIRTYYVVCASWTRTRSSEPFAVSRSDYDQVVLGQSEVHVTTSAGGLGIEWIRAKKLVLRPKGS